MDNIILFFFADLLDRWSAWLTFSTSAYTSQFSDSSSAAPITLLIRPIPTHTIYTHHASSFYLHNFNRIRVKKKNPYNLINLPGGSTPKTTISLLPTHLSLQYPINTQLYKVRFFPPSRFVKPSHWRLLCYHPHQKSYAFQSLQCKIIHFINVKEVTLHQVKLIWHVLFLIINITTLYYNWLFSSKMFG